MKKKLSAFLYPLFGKNTVSSVIFHSVAYSLLRSNLALVYLNKERRFETDYTIVYKLEL